jgi:hypothetical protein
MKGWFAFAMVCVLVLVLARPMQHSLSGIVQMVQ